VQKLSQAIEQAGEGIIITNVEGMIEYVNAAFSNMTGYHEQELLGKRASALSRTASEENESLYDEVWASIHSGEIWSGKMVERRKDGTSFPTVTTISSIRSKAKEVTHLLLLQQDISVQESLEKQLFQAQKMESLGTLVGGIAHDFNNALAGITGNTYLAKRAAAELPAVLDKLAVIESLSFRSAEHIKSLLSFARKGVVRKNALLLDEFLNNLIRMYRGTLSEDIELTAGVLAEGLSVRADERLLQQVLVNILNNAKEALHGVKNASILIQMEAYVAEDAFLLSHPECVPGRYACISIHDKGCGIRREHLPHIFEPFYTTKNTEQGSGLGLAMAFGAVQTHAGAIAVESEEGVGSTVFIYLPLLNTSADDRLMDDEQAVEGYGETILLVDDDRSILSVGQEVLEGLNYRVLTASNGQEAMEVFNLNAPSVQLVVIDVVMPVMSGVDAVREMRRLQPDLKVIFATGYERDQLRTSDRMDVETVMSKPFKVKDFSLIIRRKLDGAA